MVVMLPEWAFWALNTSGHTWSGASCEFLGHSWKGRGERGVVGRPLPTKRGNPSGMGYTRAATRFQVINNPCLYQGHRHLLGIPGRQRLLAVKWLPTFLCLYQVMGDSLFIPGHWRFLVYTRRSELFTPVAAVWRALLGPKHSRFACVVPGRARSTPVGRFWAASFLRLSRLRDVHNGRRPFSTTQGSNFR